MARLAHLNALRALEAAARHLSFVKAADELGVTPAAVGQQIRLLEEWLGLPLFVRAHGRLALSAEAQSVLPELREGFDRLSRVLDRLRAQRSTGILTVSVPPAFAALWLTPRLHRFRDRHPDLDVRIDATQRLTDLRAGEADLAVRYGAGRWDGLNATLLFGEELFPVAAPSAARVEKPEDLLRHTLIHDATMDRTAGFPGWREWLAEHALPELPQGRGLSINATVAVLLAAVEGHGVALGRSRMVEGYLTSGRLVRLFPDLSGLPAQSYFIVHTLEAGDEPKVASFTSWLREEAASVAGAT